MNITESCFAHRSCDKVALLLLRGVDQVDSYTYGEMGEAIQKLAAGLATLQLKPFSRIFLRSENSLDFLLLYFAAMRASLVPCALDPLWNLSVLLLCIQEATPVLYYESETVALNPPLPHFCRQLTAPELDILKQTEARKEAAMTTAEDPAFLIFTAGSIHKPKAAMYAHRFATTLHEWCELSPEDRVLHTGGPHLLYTMRVNFFDPWQRGATAVAFAGRMTPQESLQMIEKHLISLFASTPSFYREMVSLPQKIREHFTLSSLRFALSAGEPLSAVVQEEWEAFFHVPLLQGFLLQDAEGYFWHHHRMGAIVKTVGPICIAAEELEVVFRHHPHVLEAAAAITLDEKGREMLTLFIVPYEIEEEENILEQRLLGYAKQQLSSLKIPDRIVFLEHLPKRSDGTIDRDVLHFL